MLRLQQFCFYQNCTNQTRHWLTLSGHRPEIYRAPGWFHTNIVPYTDWFYLFLPALIPKLVKLYKSDNSAVDWQNFVFWAVALNKENHRCIIYVYQDLRQWLRRGVSLLLKT